MWDKYYSKDKLLVQSANFRGSFGWRDILKLLSKFKGLAMVSL